MVDHENDHPIISQIKQLEIDILSKSQYFGGFNGYKTAKMV